MRYWIGFTGGYDSTYISWRLLKETNHEITLVNYSQTFMTKNREFSTAGASAYQQVNCRRISKWLKKNVRDHKFKIINQPNFPNNTDFAKQYMHDCAELANNDVADVFVHGLVGFYTDRWKRMLAEFEKYATKGRMWFPLTEWKKDVAHQMLELPEELEKMAISCHGPGTEENGNLIECGGCPKCIRNQLVKENLSNGNSPERAMEMLFEEPIHPVLFQAREFRKQRNSVVWNVSVESQKTR